jgi:ribonuclease PH
MNVVMNDQGHFVEIQGTAEGHAFRMEELEAMLGLARGGIAAVIQIQRAALGQG